VYCFQSCLFVLLFKYQENIATLNDMAKQRQPVDLVLGLFQVGYITNPNDLI